MKLHHALFAPIALDGADLHGRINTGAHAGAYGTNDLKPPTDAQAQAGNYKMGRTTVQGLRIAIEQPHGSIRNGKGADGKEWSSRMAAHYGYFEGTRGADGDGIDCFVGPFPESETVFLINQRNKGGGFDEHKVMLGFMSERHARGAYLDSYERGWAGLQSMVPMSIPQLRWWIKHGNKRLALNAESLPPEASKTMTKKINWTDTQPDGVSYDQVLYELRRMDGPDGLLLDGVTMAEIMEDTDGVIALDALVVENAQLARMSERLRSIMDRSGGQVKAQAVQVSEPFKARGVTNIATVFELSDGQTVSIFFHNPDTAPNKLAPGDEMISWKWLLNKKDITIVVAPEKGQDLNPRTVAQRIMKLAEKNSPAFQKANAKRAERMGNIEAIRGRIAEKEATLNELVAQVEAAQLVRSQKNADQEVANAATREQVKKWLEGSGYAVKDAAMGQYTKTIGERVMFVTAAKLQLSAMLLDASKLGTAALNPIAPDFKDALIPTSDGALQPAMGYAAGFEAVTGFVEGREREAVTVVPAGEDEAAEVGPFGPVFAGFTNNPEGAIEVLMAEKEGEVADAFMHSELGPIAFVYGDESMGLRHIEAKRGIQWVRRIPEILRAGRVERDPRLPRAYIIDDADPASVTVIRLDWDGQQKSWLVTAHPDDIGKWSGSGKTSGTTGEESGQVQGNPSLPNPHENSSAKVDAAYQFANATDAFKVRVAESIDKEDYSEFASAKAMDMKAKELGAEIHWGMGAALDSVRAEEAKTATTKKYHKTMAKFHGSRAGMTLDSVTFDDASDFARGNIVGKIMQGGELKGRAVIGGDGKAMVFVGKSDDQRVVSTASGNTAAWGEDERMVEWLLKPQAEPEAQEPAQPEPAPEPTVTPDLIDSEQAAQILRDAGIAEENLAEHWPKPVEVNAVDAPDANAGQMRSNKFSRKEVEDAAAKFAAQKPEPAPAPAANAEDRAFFMSVIDGTHPEILEPELADKLAQAYERHAGDSEITSLFMQAGNAYTQAMLAATEGV